MNYKRFSIIFSIFVFFAVGCSKNNDHLGPSNDGQKHANRADEVRETTTPKPTTPDVVSKLKLEGDIKHIYYADEDKVFIVADKLYLYDTDTRKILQEAPHEEVLSERFWVTDNGYVAVRQSSTSDHGESVMTDGAFRYKATFYDYDLNIVSEFDLNQLLADDDMLMSTDAISFSASGTQVAFATYSGLYIYDFATETKNTIIDLTSEDAKERSGMVNIEQIGFTNEDQRIAFKAQSFDIPADPDKPSFATCGIVNIDGSELLNRTFDNFSCQNLTAYNHLLLFAEDPTVVSGKALVMEMPSHQTKMHTLMEKAESGFISGSNAGRYFATPIAHKTGWTIRVYHTETGKLEAEQQVSNDGNDHFMSHEPVIKLIDETRTCIVLLGSKRDDIESKVIISQF